MKSRGGILGAGGLDAPAFVARPARVLRGGSGRGRAVRVRAGRGEAGRARAAAGRALAAAFGRRAGRQGRRACGRPGSRAGYISAPAAPQIRARPCRAMVGGATGPATSAAPPASPRHVSPVPRHHAWRGTGIWPRQGNRHGQKC